MPKSCRGAMPCAWSSSATRKWKAARNAWEGARARARLDRALPDPEFEFEELPRVGLHDHGEHTIGVSQRVEFPLKWWHRFRAGRRQAEAARLALFETAKLDLGMRAKRAYDRIALQKSLLRHARQDLELAREVLRQATIRFEAGDVPQLDVMRGKGRSRKGNQSPDRGGKRPDRGKKPSSMRSWPARCKPRTR